MGKFFKLFNFTKVERAGFIVLSIAIVLINFGVFIYNSFRTTPPLKHQIYYLENASLNKEDIDIKSNNNYNTPSSYVNKKFDKISYFQFDPNKASKEEWEKLGFSSKQIQVIQNYLYKGGRFKHKDDLKKIYSISENDFTRIEPYILITPNLEKSKENIPSKTNINYKGDNINLNISINTADTSELKQLKGIGSILALRIVKFRDALGGFHTVDQIKEVYGLSDETYQQIKSNLNASKDQIKKIKINLLPVKELSKHPYISNKLAQVIVNYRIEHGDYADIHSLSKNKALDQEFLRKIEPYLEF